MKALYTKLALTLLALFLAITAIDFALMIYTSRVTTEEVNQRVNRGLAATIARERPVIRDAKIDWHMLYNVFDALMAVNPTIEIYLLDESGRITAFSAPKGAVKRTTVSLAPIQRFLAGEPLPIRGDDPRDVTRKKIFSVTRLRPNGYLYVILGGEHYDSVVQQLSTSAILQQSAFIAAGGLVFAFGAALVIFGFMTRRLRQLGEAMEAKIALQVEQLKEVDLHRRELVANVSHDLRTPLASLRGYLDTLLLKEGQLTAEEQRRFLEIASRHSERLGKLIEELFELAKLDSQVTPIRVESFSMPELVQDVVQKFQLRAEQSGVRLTADIRPDLPLVSGDIALMERVLENLIENAIRYTPEGGSVTVSLVPGHDRLTVRVSDTGRGIAEESLPYIFDRFYRGEESRGEGAGLGLAIARRILELHGASLSAQSKVSAGTTFTFTVACA